MERPPPLNVLEASNDRTLDSTKPASNDLAEAGSLFGTAPLVFGKWRAVMKPSRDQIENRLVLAGQQVERARQIVARQQRILDSLRKSGRPTAEAEILLDRLERSVGIFQSAERQLRRMLAAQG